LEPPAALDDVVRDMLGELANMIGGNLKSVLAPGIRLSMPSVVEGSDYSLRVCGAQVRERLAFQCAEGPFWVTILAMRSSQQPSGDLP
jgi:chemotaxis protein CheX